MEVRLLSWWVEFIENEESWKASSRWCHWSWDLGKWVRESGGTHEKTSASGMGEAMRTRLGHWPWGQRESLTVPKFLPSFHSAGVSLALASVARATAMWSLWNFLSLWLHSAPTSRCGSCSPSTKLADARGGWRTPRLSVAPSEEE